MAKPQKFGNETYDAHVLASSKTYRKQKKPKKWIPNPLRTDVLIVFLLFGLKKMFIILNNTSVHPSICPYIYTPSPTPHPHANIVCGWVYCFRVVRLSVCLSATLWFLPNILKTQKWLCINFCRHIDICKVFLHIRK